MPHGHVTGIDISAVALEKARAVALKASIPTTGPGSLNLIEGNILERLPFDDGTFDVVFASQVFGHIPGEENALRAFAELRRVLKKGGILATRDGMEMHFYPKHLQLDRLWQGNSILAANKGRPVGEERTGMSMPVLFRKAGFEKTSVGAGATSFSGPEMRNMLAWRAKGQLTEGDEVYKSWVEVGIGKEEIEETLGAVEKWASTEDAWCASLQCEMLGWK